jgi:4'-phosphopantetheinyl transferase
MPQRLPTNLPPHISPIALPDHAPADVRAWLVEVDLTAPLEVASAGLLDATELARARRYLRHSDSARFATVRAALRMLLSLHVDADASSLVIETDARGRPALASPEAPDFNVSHSGAFGAIALSATRSLGIDIEEARVSLDWRELARAVFSEADRRTVDATAPGAQREAFFECWSAKEAVLKAHGTGMGAGALTMDSFSVMPRAAERYALSEEAGDFIVCKLAAPPGYVMALSWSS